MSDFFNLVEHRKSIQRNVIRLSDTIAVIPMEQSNEDELRNQLRQLEAKKLGRKVNRLIEEAEEASDAGRDEEATQKMTEATELSRGGLEMMLQTLKTLVCDEDGKKLTIAQLRSVIGNQDEASVVLDAVAKARVSADPQMPARAGATPN